MEWNKKMREARKNARMTQAELADGIGVCRSTIANYELGRRKPTFLELKKIAEKLRVDVNYLVEAEETNKEDELIVRANNVFSDMRITDEDKDLLFQDIMEIYLKGKKENANRAGTNRTSRL